MATSFNYDAMQLHMKNLDANFAYFALTLKKANDLVNDFVNVSSASALYGEKAKKVLDLWNQNASTFGDFYQNFENWSALMINASNAYHKFEESVFSSHQTTGDKADDVAVSRESLRGLAQTPSIDRDATLSNPNRVFTLPDGSTIQYMLDEENNTYAFITNNEKTIKRVFHEDGTFTDYDISTSSQESLQGDASLETLDTNETVTVSSGQKVTLNGEECYFVMRDPSGNEYYVKSDDANAEVYMAVGEKLIPYVSPVTDDVVSREDFINTRRNYTDCQWNVTYNNGLSPYQEIGTEVNQSFTENVPHPEYTKVVYDDAYLHTNAVTLDQLDRGNIGLGNEEVPSVLYVAPGQSIKYDVPWSLNDNAINGGDNGVYLVYNPERQAYFKIDENGGYETVNEGTFGLSISKDQLLSSNTVLNK